MPLACARCGAPNPDGNAYCQSCGNPLVAPVPAGAAAGAPASAQPSWLPSPPAAPPQYAPKPQYTPAPEYAAPPAYQSPYYTPAGPTAPVQRTSWMMLIAPVLIIAVVLVGGGTIFAMMHNQTSTPVVTAQDTGAPAFSPPPGSTVVSNTTIDIAVPAGWSVVTKDAESITLTDTNNDGAVTVASGPQNPTHTAQQNVDAINTSLRQKYPDTAVCTGWPVTAGSFNGAKGYYWKLCFTLTSGSRSVPAVASLFAGANADGTAGYLVMALTAQGNLTTFNTEDRELLQSIHWKLT